MRFAVLTATYGAAFVRGLLREETSMLRFAALTATYGAARSGALREGAPMLWFAALTATCGALGWRRAPRAARVGCGEPQANRNVAA